MNKVRHQIETRVRQSKNKLQIRNEYVFFIIKLILYLRYWRGTWKEREREWWWSSLWMVWGNEAHLSWIQYWQSTSRHVYELPLDAQLLLNSFNSWLGWLGWWMMLRSSSSAAYIVSLPCAHLIYAP